MKNHLFNFLLLISSLFIDSIYAQGTVDFQDFFNRTSLEAGVGGHMTLVPTKNVSNSEFLSFNTIYAGLHYELNEEWGVRGSYAYHNFEHKEFNFRNLTMHKLMLEATYSVRAAFP